MCGIAGYYSPQHLFPGSELQGMTDALAHRGPDAAGYFNDDIAGLGHRRLSILDLSAGANQPMYSRNGRYVMVYNGEVYNYEEIAARLQKHTKVEFQTTSDSEVILEAYIRYGAAFVNELNGMFALAIYDTNKRELFVCRDRIGIKPLYYYWDGINFAFASELAALIKAKAIPLDIDPNAVYQFLHTGSIPAPHSIFASISKLRSGHWLKITQSGMEEQCYWSVQQHISKELITSETEALSQLDTLMTSSVNYQLKSDVPFGVFLSGGIDSSLVAAKASAIAAQKISTFSIGFEESRYNESAYARAVAGHLGTQHHEFTASYKDAIDLTDTIFEVYGEPFADSSFIPTMLVSKLARRHVTVALSGEGGDELFLGYGSYQWAERLNRPLIKAMRQPIAMMLAASGSRYKRHAGYFRYPAAQLKHSHIFSQEQYYFSLPELDKALHQSFKAQAGKQYAQTLERFASSLEQLPRSLQPAEQQAVYDLCYYLQDDLLTKVDRASMHYSLETRVPYLDHRLVEFALNLSPELKYRQGTSKYLLKTLLYRHVPKSLFDRPKQGFALPLEKWLGHELRFLIEENLSEVVIKKYRIVDYSYVSQLKKQFLSGISYQYNRLWLLIVLHKWLQKHVK